MSSVRQLMDIYNFKYGDPSREGRKTNYSAISNMRNNNRSQDRADRVEQETNKRNKQIQDRADRSEDRQDRREDRADRQEDRLTIQGKDAATLAAQRILQAQNDVEKGMMENEDKRMALDVMTKVYKAKGLIPLSPEEQATAHTVANDNLGISTGDNDDLMKHFGKKTQAGKVLSLFNSEKDSDKFENEKAVRDDTEKRRTKIRELAKKMATNEITENDEYQFPNNADIEKYIPEAEKWLYPDVVAKREKNAEKQPSSDGAMETQEYGDIEIPDGFTKASEALKHLMDKYKMPREQAKQYIKDNLL